MGIGDIMGDGSSEYQQLILFLIAHLTITLAKR